MLSRQTTRPEHAQLHWPTGADPVSQASMWTPLPMYPWQANVCRAMMPTGARVACVTPNESGKTAVVIPVVGLSFMAAFPGAQVASTAGVGRQVEDILWPVLRAALAPYPNWKINEEGEITAPRVRGLPPSKWKAFTTKDPEAAEGFHSRWYKDENGRLVYAPLLVIVDEAKSVKQGIIDAFSRCDPDVWLTISTPGEDSGPFFDCFDTLRGDPWECIEVGWNDCPHLTVGRKYDERRRLIDKLGEDNPLVLSMVHGKFFRAGGRLVFESLQDVQRAMSGMIRHVSGDRRAALDFSGGGDEQVFACREGNHVLEMVGFRLKDTTRLGDEFIKLFRKYELRAEDIIADNGGLGKPCIDYLERMGYPGIRRYSVSAKARDASMYVNRAAEDHFTLRHLMEQSAIALPNDPDLLTQMRKRTYVMPNDESNRIRLTPKEKLRKDGVPSPDRLDTITMLFSDMPPSVMPALEPRRGSSRCGYADECFQQEEDIQEVPWGSTWAED